MWLPEKDGVLGCSGLGMLSICGLSASYSSSGKYGSEDSQEEEDKQRRKMMTRRRKMRQSGGGGEEEEGKRRRRKRRREGEISREEGERKEGGERKLICHTILNEKQLPACN